MKRGFTIWELVAVLGGLLVVAAIALPIFAPSGGHEPTRSSRCRSNMRKIGLGFAQYIQDYDEKFPPARSGKTSRGWVESLDPYLKSNEIYWCPSMRDVLASRWKGKLLRTDYFMNARLSARANSFAAPDRRLLIMSGETEANFGATSPHYALSALPMAWSTDSSSPRYRHEEGSNFGFVDGHVKWLRATETISSVKVAGEYTFAPQ